LPLLTKSWSPSSDRASRWKCTTRSNFAAEPGFPIGNELLCIIDPRSKLDPHAGVPEARGASPANERIGIGTADDNPHDAGPEHGIDARRSAPVMVTRLERYEERGAARSHSGLAQRHDFGVRAARPFMMA
jgi:hypothetical protein